jgi:iron complex outermembrane receptor protein
MAKRVSYLGLLFSAIAPLAAQAQTAAAQIAAPAQAETLGEIVITAQRRVERLDQVPIAASVVSGAELTARGVSSLDDLGSLAPALNVQNQQALSYVNIRGVGLQTTNPTTSSGVANYSDGFFIPHESAINDAYYDVGQIEVLRGPQGTLVGQNSTGGAILGKTELRTHHGIPSADFRRLRIQPDTRRGECARIRSSGHQNRRECVPQE